MLVVLTAATRSGLILEVFSVFLIAFFTAIHPISVFHSSLSHSTLDWDTILPQVSTRKHLTPPEPQSMAMRWSGDKHDQLSKTFGLAIWFLLISSLRRYLAAASATC